MGSVGKADAVGPRGHRRCNLCLRPSLTNIVYLPSTTAGYFRANIHFQANMRPALADGHHVKESPVA